MGRSTKEMELSEQRKYEDGLARLVAALGCDVSACVEMMSGAAWVRDQQTSAGWRVQIANARKAKVVASLAVKTDIIDACVLADSLGPIRAGVWAPSLDDRALREGLLRRMHLVRLRASAKNRAHGIITQRGVKLTLKRLAGPTRPSYLSEEGFCGWRWSVAERSRWSSRSTTGCVRWGATALILLLGLRKR